MLLRLAYLDVTNTLTLLRLFPRSDRDKDAEILALRHQIAVLQRHLGPRQIRFEPADWALLAALLHPCPHDTARPTATGPSRHDPQSAPHPHLPPSRRGLPPALPTRPATHQCHLLHALREYEVFYNAHRPHQGLANAGHWFRCLNRSPIRTNSPG